MTEYHIKLLFDKKVSTKVVSKIYDDFIESDAYEINTTDFIMMRAKLIYVPVIMATAVYGPPKVERGKPPWGSFAERLYTECQSYFTKREGGATLRCMLGAGRTRIRKLMRG